MRLVLVLALLLAGCGLVDPYTRSREPDANGSVVRKAVTAAFKDAKLAGTPMVSRLFEANLVSRGDWLMCLRGSASPKSDTYTLYFTGYSLVGAQRSVLVDRCDDQAYAPYVLEPEVSATATPTSISARHGAVTTQAIPSQTTPISASTSSGRTGEPMVLTPR